jgi:hypothetical protein
VRVPSVNLPAIASRAQRAFRPHLEVKAVTGSMQVLSYAAPRPDAIASTSNTATPPTDAPGSCGLTLRKDVCERARVTAHVAQRHGTAYGLLLCT